VEAFRHYFEQAVRRRLRSAYPVAVSVSGGLDSSAVFCLAETLRRRAPEGYPPLLGISYTPTDGSPADESAFVSAIERAYGIAITRIPLSVGFLNGCREAIWHCENPVVDEGWHTTHTLLQTAREQGARVLLTGLWGDQMLFDQAYLIDLFRRLAWGQVWAHLKEFGRWNTDVGPGYFRRQFFRDLIKHHVPDARIPLLRRLRAKMIRDTPDRPWYTEEFRNRIRQCASEQTLVRGPFATAHARSLYQEARSRHHVQCLEWNNKVASMHGLEIAFPFLDRELVSFLMGIPGDMQTWKGVPRAPLREAMRGVLPDEIVARTWKGDFTHVVNEAMERGYSQLVRCLEDGGMAVSFGYVKGEVMREELARLRDRIRGPDCGITWSLSDLLGLELWLQVFFGDKAIPHAPAARPWA
jgi:asparagine synthase (glutamine-hydrolysing)